MLKWDCKQTDSEQNNNEAISPIVLREQVSRFCCATARAIQMKLHSENIYWNVECENRPEQWIKM